ncbi:MAG: class I SAM-dependent methyltransferase, partial [Anaerolineales bacterium]|nr:class I SAM-dependent methyltransferase [Anaerolineales bacterium]
MKPIWRWLLFNLWYFRQPPWDTGVSPPELMHYIQTHPPGCALDLGCGTGTNAITLANNGWKVTAVDFAKRAIKIARKKAQEAGLEINFLVQDVTNLEKLNGPYDFLLDIGCYHGLPDAARKTYLRNLEQLLKPGGDYLMYGFFKQENQAGTGLIQADVDSLSSHLILESRQDG